MMPPQYPYRSDFNPSDVPIPTTRAPISSSATVRRAKTLTRPERSVAPVPLIKPPPGGPSIPIAGRDSDGGFDLWRLFAAVITFWAPSFLLSSIGGLKDKGTQQAWREKMALCSIVMVLCAGVGFITVGFQKMLCPEVQATSAQKYTRLGTMGQTLGVNGVLFNTTRVDSSDVNFLQLSQIPGQDITPLFQRDAASYPACAGINFRVAVDEPCSSATPCPLGPLNTTKTFQSLKLDNTSLLVGYDWDQVAQFENYFVIDGAVLNMNPYMKLHPNPIPTDNVDDALRTLLQTQSGTSGRDGTRTFYSRTDLKSVAPCLIERYYAGNIDKITPGCFVSQLFLYVGLIVILALVFVRFTMACVFNWFLSHKLAGPPNNLHQTAISPAVMPEGANMSIDNKHGTAPWAGAGGGKKLAKPQGGGRSARSFNTHSSNTLGNDEPMPVMSLAQIGAELFAVCLVTCYSEGEDSLRTTLDSISTTTYSDRRKLLFVVADGMITGAGEKKSTPDICVGLLQADPRFGNPIPMSYQAVGTGEKGINRAMVYAGHYSMLFALRVYLKDVF